MEEDLWFGSKLDVTAMMDVSDGIFIDLKRLCQASNVAVEINLDAFKPTLEFNEACCSMKLDPTQTKLTGGEDYSLLVCIDANNGSIFQDFSSVLVTRCYLFAGVLKDVHH